MGLLEGLLVVFGGSFRVSLEGGNQVVTFGVCTNLGDSCILDAVSGEECVIHGGLVAITLWMPLFSRHSSLWFHFLPW